MTPISFQWLVAFLFIFLFFTFQLLIVIFFLDIQVKHPSALDTFDQMMSAVTKKKIVVFLDYDGTLAPIVDDPNHAFMSDSVSITSQFIFELDRVTIIISIL